MALPQAADRGTASNMEVSCEYINLLKPSGNFTYHQVYVKKFYVVPTLRLCVLYGSQNKQQLLPYKTLRLVFITEVESVYSAVRAESLYKTDTLRI
jgi:hypothetical protein